MSKNKQRTYSRNRRLSRRNKEIITEPDGIFMLKLVATLIAGTFWIKFGTPVVAGSVILTAIPFGLFFGLFIIAAFEKIQSNRRIQYAVLILSTILSYFLPSGVVI